MKVSVIIPAKNEEKTIEKTLKNLKKQGVYEIIVVNGRSTDKTKKIAQKYAKVITPKKGKTWRSTMMNLGAKKARGDWLCFLHADVMLPKNAFNKINKSSDAATFYLKWDSNHWLMKANQWFTNNNQLYWGTILGDHGLVIKKSLFNKLKGFKQISLMEDQEFSHRLRKHTHIQIIKHPIQVSARRYVQTGIYKQTIINNIIKFLYRLNVNHLTLRKIYQGIK